MSFFDKYTSMTSKLTIGGEEMFNLCELAKCMEMDKEPPIIEECIIVPYYISESGRYELYQYELNVESGNGETFQEYVLRITGKKKWKKCLMIFAKCVRHVLQKLRMKTKVRCFLKSNHILYI